MGRYGKLGGTCRGCGADITGGRARLSTMYCSKECAINARKARRDKLIKEKKHLEIELDFKAPLNLKLVKKSRIFSTLGAIVQTATYVSRKGTVHCYLERGVAAYKKKIENVRLEELNRVQEEAKKVPSWLGEYMQMQLMEERKDAKTRGNEVHRHWIPEEGSQKQKENSNGQDTERGETSYKQARSSEKKWLQMRKLRKEGKADSTSRQSENPNREGEVTHEVQSQRVDNFVCNMSLQSPRMERDNERDKETRGDV